MYNVYDFLANIRFTSNLNPPSLQLAQLPTDLLNECGILKVSTFLLVMHELCTSNE